jgi:UDP-2-acetamido-3-amino-2,3-dideoxy-glucuronate N-acetyltransferase
MNTEGDTMDGRGQELPALHGPEVPVAGSRPPRVEIHPLACCESENIGAATRIWAFAHVLQGAVVGAGCNLCDHTYVEGGARLGDRVTLKNGVAVWEGVTLRDDVFVGPFAVFTNDPVPRAAPYRTPRRDLRPTVVERGACIGANATIMCGVTIGEYALVGAGAVVTRDVAPYALVVGAPARQAGWLCACGARIEAPFACRCGRSYRLALGDTARLVPARHGAEGVDLRLIRRGTT